MSNRKSEKKISEKKMNTDLTGSGYTVKVGGVSFETTKTTLSKLPSFKQRFQQSDSWSSSCRLDADPKIFNHVLNTLRDTEYLVPKKYLTNVIQAFAKNGADYYAFVGRPKPALIPYVLRYDLVTDVDGVLDIPEGCVSSILDAWIEVVGPASLTELEVTVTVDPAAGDGKQQTVAYRSFSETDLVNGRELVRYNNKSHNTYTRYSLSDLSFDVKPTMKIHATPTLSGGNSSGGDKKTNMKFCIKVV